VVPLSNRPLPNGGPVLYVNFKRGIIIAYPVAARFPAPHAKETNLHMKILLRHLFGCAAAALLLAGCGKPPELMLQQLAPDAPAAAGLPPAPVAGAPTPLLDRPPFGLYASDPTRETLQMLSTAPLSPDGRYRAIIGNEGLWIARVDGAWLWQVPLPEAAAANPATNQPGGTQPLLPLQPKPGATAGSTNASQPPNPPAAPKATKYLGPLDWTSRDTLLMRDDTGTWAEVDPESATVKLLPAALQGKEWITFSPDRRRVLYYANGKTGKQLWVAKADGTEPKLLGENVTGTWGPDGNPVVTKIQPPTAVAGGKPGDPSVERQRGPHSQ